MGFALYQEVINHSKATGAAYQVHLNLAVRADDPKRECRASIARIAKETRLSVRGVKYGLQELRDLEHITSNRKGSARGINLFVMLREQSATGAPSETDDKAKQSAPGAPSKDDKVQPLHLVGQTKCTPCTQSDKKERQLNTDHTLSASQTSEGLSAPTSNRSVSVASQPGESANQKVSNADKKILVADFSANKRTPPNPPLTEICHYPEAFDALWKAYPRGGSYVKAVQTWNELKLTRDEVIGILNFLKTAKVSIEWTNEGGRYIPGLAKFLQRKGWLDKLTKQPNRGVVI